MESADLQSTPDTYIYCKKSSLTYHSKKVALIVVVPFTLQKACIMHESTSASDLFSYNKIKDVAGSKTHNISVLKKEERMVENLETPGRNPIKHFAEKENRNQTWDCSSISSLIKMPK